MTNIVLILLGVATAAFGLVTRRSPAHPDRVGGEMFDRALRARGTVMAFGGAMLMTVGLFELIV